MFEKIDETHPYYRLAKVFNDAFLQASAGKGQERHAYSKNEPYSSQVLCEMDKRLGGNAIGPRYQAVKKIYESARMDPDKAIRELHGAINYLAAAIIILEEKNNSDSQIIIQPKTQTNSNINDVVDENFGIDEKNLNELHDEHI